MDEGKTAKAEVGPFLIAFLVFHDSRFVKKYPFLDVDISPIGKFEALTIFNLGLGYLILYFLLIIMIIMSLF